MIPPFPVSDRGEFFAKGDTRLKPFWSLLPGKRVSSFLTSSYLSAIGPAATCCSIALATPFIYQLSAFLIPCIISLKNVHYAPQFCSPSYKHGMKRLVFCTAGTTVAFTFTSCFKGDHLSAGLALRMGKLSTCLRSRILEERDGSHKLQCTEHLQ